MEETICYTKITVFYKLHVFVYTALIIIHNFQYFCGYVIWVISETAAPILTESSLAIS